MKAWLITAALAGVLAGCSGGGATGCSTGTTPIGGSGGGSSSCPGDGSGSPTAADLIVTVTTSTASGIKNSGSDTATVTVTAVDSNRNVVASVPVTIAPDATAVVTTSGTATDSSGVVTGTIGVGSDRSNRMIAVSVTSGSLQKAVNIPVYGAALTATVPAKVAPGSTSSVIYHLVDASGAAMVGETVTVNGAVTSSGPTDVSGNFTLPFTAPGTAGTLEFDASAAGVSRSDVVTNTTTTIPSATGTVVSQSLAANPSTVGVNPDGAAATNKVDVRAIFLTDHNQPIPNVRVRFDLAGDKNGIGGTLSPGADVIVYSDSNGVARTTYTPGSRSSGNQAVTIRGCWSKDDFDQVTPAGAACPNGQQVTAQITVADQAVSVSITTDGKLDSPPDDSTVYRQQFSVQVVDSVNNPKSGVKVSGAAYLPRYYLGQLEYFNGAWTYSFDSLLNVILPTQCNNEDINGNGNMDVFSATDATQVEDQNGNGSLDPASADVTIVPVAPGKDTTDEFGRAHFYMEYGKNKALWDDYALTFTATVAGSEGHQTITGTLLALAEDVTNKGFPPFGISPYGRNDITNPSGIVRAAVVPRVNVTDPSTGKTVALCGKPQ